MGAEDTTDDATAEETAAAGDDERPTDDPEEIASRLSVLLSSLSLSASQRASLRIPPADAPPAHVEVVTPVGGAEHAHFHCPKTLPSPEFWPSRPLLVRNSAGQHSLPRTSVAPPLAVGEPFDISNSVFEGRGMLRVRDVTPGTEEYFKGEHLTGGHVGKEMKSSFVVTGRFKMDGIGFSELYTGQEFCHPVVQPGGWTQYAAIKAINFLAPLLRVSLSEDGSGGTYLLSPLVQTAQAVSVSESDVELTPGLVVRDDLSVLGDEEFAPMAGRQEKRKAYFSDPANLDKYEFSTELVYTFDFFDHNLSMLDFDIGLLGYRHDLAHYLNGQPIRLMSRVLPKDSDQVEEKRKVGTHAWNIEVWNEKQVVKPQEEDGED
uniref:Domain of unknown function at the cortex 1 domain-containing protein n=1 Tax=Odontella aurita TaxID=265563 RepID=A0A7S4MZS0_9STRA